MSYDVDLKIEHGDGYTTVIDVGNMTSNVGRMMRAACGGSFPEFNGLTSRQALPFVRFAWQQMKRCPGCFRAHEPDNGWGTYDQFMPYLTRFYVLLRLHPTATIYVSY